MSQTPYGSVKPSGDKWVARKLKSALYYRAGLAELESRRPLQSIHMEARQRGGAAWLLNTARAMEAEASHG